LRHLEWVIYRARHIEKAWSAEEEAPGIDGESKMPFTEEDRGENR
jgi:hypothetical protein